MGGLCKLFEISVSFKLCLFCITNLICLNEFLNQSEASGSFAENQKITAIRKVYQKGVMNPMVEKIKKFEYKIKSKSINAFRSM